MTVTYTAEVATCRGFGTFLKLLCRWRGSIYKLVWLDLLLFLIIYYTLNLTYRTFLDEDQKRIFEGIVQYCRTYVTVIPIAFVLGFYVTVVMNRWWSQYTSIPWPDPIAVYVSSNIHGQDERGRVMRRTIMRYVCLCLTMVLTMISPKVKKRFPTIEHLVESGLLLESERLIVEDLNKKFPKHSKHWLPIVWAASIVTRARKEGRIRDDFAVKTIIDELNKFRGQCGLLISYDNISVPLVYTQVVTTAVYSYFLTSAMGRQWTEVNYQSSVYVANIDIYFPVFTTLEFFFYMGWLKVAESLINPFGEDDDDFEVNWMIDRNLQVSYLIVDEMHHEHPELVRDQYWDEVFPAELPYTVATENLREEHPEASTARIDVPVEQQGMVTTTPSAIKIDEMNNRHDHTVSYKFAPSEQLINEDASSGIHFIAGSKQDNRKMVRNTSGSSNSVVQTGQGTSLSRVGSVASVIKRIFSRDETVQPPTTPTATQTDGPTGRFSVSASNASLTGKMGLAGSMKLVSDVIEEVDEQNTITSMAMKQQETRPTALSVFTSGPPTPSQPVNVPVRKQRSQNKDVLSSSAPSHWAQSSIPDTPSPGGEVISLRSQPTFIRQQLDSDTGPLSAAMSQSLDNEAETASMDSSEVDDEFERLKRLREKQRKERYLHKLMARSISAQQGAGDYILDNETLLKELIKQSQTKSEVDISSDDSHTA